VTFDPIRLNNKFFKSSAMLARRTEVMKKAGLHAVNLSKAIKHPVIDIPANSVFMRFVKPNVKYLSNYSQVFQFPPDIDDHKMGAYSLTNRYSGAIGEGKPGLNGSYWGLPMGAAGEDVHYSRGFGEPAWRPDLACKSHVTVQRAAAALNHWEDKEMPEQLLFSGNTNANIIVARTIRGISGLNLNLFSSEVQAHLKAIQPKFQALLDDLEFNTVTEAIEDGQFRDFARHFVYGACHDKLEAIWASTVRHEEAMAMPGFDKDAAQNLVLLGKGHEPLTNRLVGVGVITIQASDADGLVVSARKIHGTTSPYYDGTPNALMVIPKP
jgi:hypothetical protein